jgi:hypothetical protein
MLSTSESIVMCMSYINQLKDIIMAVKTAKQDSVTKEIGENIHRLAVESVDLSDLQVEFANCRSKMTDGITLPMHELVYEQDYLLENSKVLGKFINHLHASHRELNIETVLGKLAIKLPFPKGYFDDRRKFNNFTRKQASYILAGILIEVFIDARILKTSSRIVYDPKPKTLTYIILGSSDAKVDLLGGYSVEPGASNVTHTSNGFRVGKLLKGILSDMSKMRFQISEHFDEALLLHGYSLTGAYNAPSKNESQDKKYYRFFNTYKNAWNELKARGDFSLTAYPDDRLRLYYSANVLIGARPQGKLWETLAIDRAEPKLLDHSAIKHVKHIIMTTLHGKMSVDSAVAQFTNYDFIDAYAADPFAVKLPDVPFTGNEGKYRAAEAEFGERILLNKCAGALRMHANGIPCPYLFGKDLTNSGLIMAGNSFRAPKMLEGANCMGSSDVMDSHMQFGKAHQVDGVLTRIQIKDIHTPLLHGSSVFTIAEKLKFYVPNPDDVTEQAVMEHNVEAYGHEVNNIEEIAKFGYHAVNNYVNKLTWNLPDGEKAQHNSVMQHTPFKVYAVSTRKKGSSYHAYNLVQTMPLAVDSDGRNAYDSSLGVNTKRRGLFANITHSLDAYALRNLVTALLAAGEVFLLKHDDYMVSPDMFDLVVSNLQGTFHILQQENLYQTAIDQIAADLGIDAPELIMGSAPNRVMQSVNFLIA